MHVFGLNHSLHRGVKGAKGFYTIYAGLISVSATIVLIPEPLWAAGTGCRPSPWRWNITTRSRSSNTIGGRCWWSAFPTAVAGLAPVELADTR